MPNLDIKEQVPGAMPVITIRGVGLNDFGAANSPSAGVYVDQVYVASIAMMAFDMYDLERIEVLKGPQGTLYGRNSTAGAHQHHHAQAAAATSTPTRRSATATTTRWTSRARVNVPLGDTAALRFSGKSDPAGRRLLGEPPAARRDDRQARPDDGARAARARAGRQPSI